METNKPIVLLPQFIDRSGRVVFNLHSWPEGRKTPGTVAETPVLGQLRLDPDDETSVAYEPRFDLVDQMEAGDE